LKRAGWRTAIVEKDVETHFGGTCISTGCIPTKALIEKTIQTGNFDTANEHKKRLVEKIRSGTLRHVGERAGVEIIPGHAKFLNNHTIEVENREITAELFVIATGSETYIPPIEGISETSYITSKEMLDNETLPKRILIIGAGRIGLELGQLYHQLGSQVSVFEGFPHIFANAEDFEMSDIIENHLIESGINIFKGNFVSKVSEDRTPAGEIEYTVHLINGNHVGTYKGDMLLVATGRIPSTKNLDLHNTDVQLNRTRILVNDYLQTNARNIFALGDVTGNPMFTNWANYQSGHLVTNLKISKDQQSMWVALPEKHIPRIVFIQPEFSSIGLTEEQARENYGEDVVVYKFHNKWLGKSMIVGETTGLLKGIGLKGSNVILGAHLWGERTGSLIQLIAFAMENDLGWKELSSMVYGHPVLVEGVYSLASGMKGKVEN
ncbi:MAG: dihydrolipoyl dehydrogenase family protein, partial [Candidatus Kariarchaeaceae archaeon]